MRSFQTEAIILKRMDLGEADRLLTLFSVLRGKVRALNKGARKPLSKLAGHLEPFALTDLQLQEGRNFYTVVAASTIDPFIRIRDDLAKTGTAYAFLEMVDALTVDEQAQPAVFELLKASLTQLESLPERAKQRLLLVAATLRLLIELGYRPELTDCVHCHQPLQPDDNRFSVRLGGVLGPECRREDDSAPTINSLTIKAFRLAADYSLETVLRLKLSPANLKELEVIIENYLLYHTGRPLRSSDFMRDTAD